jgi:hypothetical protein
MKNIIKNLSLSIACSLLFVATTANAQNIGVSSMFFNYPYVTSVPLGLDAQSATGANWILDSRGIESLTQPFYTISLTRTAPDAGYFDFVETSTRSTRLFFTPDSIQFYMTGYTTTRRVRIAHIIDVLQSQAIGTFPNGPNWVLTGGLVTWTEGVEVDVSLGISVGGRGGALEYRSSTEEVIGVQGRSNYLNGSSYMTITAVAGGGTGTHPAVARHARFRNLRHYPDFPTQAALANPVTELTYILGDAGNSTYLFFNISSMANNFPPRYNSKGTLIRQERAFYGVNSANNCEVIYDLAKVIDPPYLTTTDLPANGRVTRAIRIADNIVNGVSTPRYSRVLIGNAGLHGRPFNGITCDK